MNGITGALTAVPFWLMIAVVTILAILVSGKKIAFPLFTFIGLSLIANQGLWSDLMSTITTCLTFKFIVNHHWSSFRDLDGQI